MSDVNLKIRHAKRQNAQNLDLSNFNLDSIPAEVFNLKTLLNLNLSNNKIREVDKAVENLKNLNELNLENNEISLLPIEIISLTNLKIVKIDNNPIYANLKDFNFNWKSSVKEFLSNGGGGSSKEEEASSSLKESKDSLSNNKKTPFNFNMNNTNTNNLILKLQNKTSTNFNFKKSVGEIPRCNLFDKASNLNKIKVDSYNGESNNNTNTHANPVRIQSGNLNKKVALNALLKAKKSQTFNELAENEKEEKLNTNEYKIDIVNKNDEEEEEESITTIPTIPTFDVDLILLKEKEIEDLKSKFNKCENELKHLKNQNIKKEDEYKNSIKLLESEIRNLRLKSESEKKVENVITNKRNWMDSNNTSNTTTVTSSTNLQPTFAIRPTLEDNDSKVKDLETQLQKEVQTNKRLKNEIDRLNQQLTINKGNNNTGENLLKNVQELNYEEISLENQIGQGGFSVIYKGTWSFLPVAVKLIFDPNVTEDLLNEFNNEIRMLSLLRHPNIILLIGICSKPQKLAIITEYVQNGSLFDLLHRTNKEVPSEVRIKIIIQLVRTLAFIHQNGIVHRDIKSHNVLIDENFNVKMCDFGLAKYKTELNLGSGQFSGTPAYMAPELFMKRAYDEKIDIFSFGTLMWEILVRKIPYDGYEVSEIKSKVMSEDKLFLPKTISTDFGNIINDCRSSNPSKRPSFLELAKINFSVIK